MTTGLSLSVRLHLLRRLLAKDRPPIREDDGQPLNSKPQVFDFTQHRVHAEKREADMRMTLGKIVGLLVVVGVTVSADSPHFIKASASLDNDANLIVSWKEAGLGSNALITYTASAQATATYQCVNHGGNCPSAANKQTVNGPVSSTGTFSSGKNGSITASLTVEPPPSTLQCPGNQVVEVAAVSYTNIALADTTNGVTAAVPASLSVDNGVCP